MVTPKTALTPSERERIDAALASARARSSATLALAIVPASDRYALFPVAWAALLALIATGAAALAFPRLGIATGVAVNAASFAILSALLDLRPIRPWLVPGRVKRSHARHLAHYEFALRIVGRAHQRNGILLFVALAERYVEVLADRDIHARVAPDTWNRLVADFVSAVKDGRLADGVVAALESCAAVLETHYPKEPTAAPPAAGKA